MKNFNEVEFEQWVREDQKLDLDKIDKAWLRKAYESQLKKERKGKFAKNLRVKNQIKNIPNEHLILQACATIEDIMKVYINYEDVDFGKHNYLIENSYKNVYKICTYFQEYCEKNVNKKFISGINEKVVLANLEKAELENIGFNLESKIEKNDFIIYNGIKRLIIFIKEIEVDNKELKNKIKMLNMYVFQFLNVFKKELAS